MRVLLNVIHNYHPWFTYECFINGDYHGVNKGKVDFFQSKGFRLGTEFVEKERFPSKAIQGDGFGYINITLPTGTLYVYAEKP